MLLNQWRDNSHVEITRYGVDVVLKYSEATQWSIQQVEDHCPLRTKQPESETQHLHVMKKFSSYNTNQRDALFFKFILVSWSR